MALPRWMLPLLVLVTGAITLVPAARQFHDELFRSNLNNVARKKRSLDTADAPEYYNDLHSFKYHGGDTDRKFDRDFDEDDEEIEFLPGDNGQLETVGEGLQGLNNKLLERALLDYLETLPEQEEPVASIFRERERSGSRKRGGAGDARLNLDDKDLTKLFVEELQDGSPYGPLVEVDDDDYLTALQSLYDRYRAGRGNKVYETAGPMSWGELLGKGPLRSQTRDGSSDGEFVDRDEEQGGILYLPVAERRNVNARFPIGREFSSYRRLTKRYPVAKRSPKPTQAKLKTTDPKNMAENLKPKEEENERKDKLEQMDSKLKYIKDLIVEEAMRYAASEDEADLQKVKDKLMSRMAAAYSLQKMRKALSDLRNNVAAQKEAQRTQKEAQNNFTSNFRENSNSNTGSGSKADEKRNGIHNNVEEGESVEEPRNCPELEAIEWRCRTVDNLAGDTSRMLYVPCVKLQICKACAQDEDGLLPCLANYALEAEKICDTLESRERSGQAARTMAMAAVHEDERQSCASAALLLSQLHPPTAASAQCRARNARGESTSCLRRYHARYEHRYFRTSPAYEGTAGRRLHHEGALDALQQTMSEQ
ncbi:uncharacterized protein LOC105829650 isoform X2 [Monomorium pharaonis]|uniref:uncharacterized protein LOC105829650 isoform X2 n=1 Tax=Monomorium pharaonis TaxID=307658 RepID=UPI0017467417|nr:uncharacterized protein LOC105829650 isoform X2 [Monomorium pharaonis]